MNQLYCHQFNQGSSEHLPIVMLHGFLGESNDWQGLAQSLPKGIGCYAIDLPGHGKSSDIELPTEFGFAQCSELISTTLAKQGICRYILLGYSLGGRIALYHACHQLEQVCGLILESSHFGLVDNKQKQQRLVTDSQWSQRFLAQHLPEVLNNWYQQTVFSSLTSIQKENLVAMRRHLKGDVISKMLLATSLGRQDFLANKLAKTKIPSYYLHGKKDAKYQEVAKTFKQKHSNLQTIEFSQAGHNIHFEQPKNFSDTIIDIYSQLS